MCTSPERNRDRLKHSSRSARITEIAVGLTMLPIRTSPLADLELALEGAAKPPRLSDFVARSAAMRRTIALARIAAADDVPLLITGESGVGKERLARAIHSESARAAAPFAAVDCGGLPQPAPASDTPASAFGPSNGALRAGGARHALFGPSTGGMLFLHDVAKLPQHLFDVLLEAVDRRFGNRAPVDVRLAAATARAPRHPFNASAFADVLVRRGAVVLEVPPLRERREDIPELANGMLAAFRARLAKPQIQKIAAAALDRLIAHPFEHNARELARVLERAVRECEGTSIEPEHLDVPPPPSGRANQAHPAPRQSARLPRAPLPSTKFEVPMNGMHGPREANEIDALLPENWASLSLREVREASADRAERAYLCAVLAQTGGVVKDAAARSGLAPRSFYDRLRRHGIRGSDYRRRPQKPTV